MSYRTWGYALTIAGCCGIAYTLIALPTTGLDLWQIVLLVCSLIIFMLGIGFVQLTRSRPGQKQFIRYLFPITLFVIIDGYLFKLLELPSAGVQIILGSFFLCFALSPVIARSRFERWKGYTDSSSKITGLMLADTVGLSLVVLAILFRMQKWPGYYVMGTIGIVLLILSLILWNQMFETLFGLQLKTQDKLENAYEALQENHEQLEEKSQEITDSIQYAKRIQTAILPPDRIVKEYLKDSFILYKPKDIVAGDFYWMETVEDTVYFAAADCTGHGVPGAMVSVICNTGLNRSVREFELRDPAKILGKCRELVIKEFEKSDEEVKDGMDISLCALNLQTLELQWAGANNPLWIATSRQLSTSSEAPESRKPVRSANGLTADGLSLYEVKADKQPIGKYDIEKPFTSHSIQLAEGDTLYIFSDGFPDQFGGEHGKKYKSGKFKRTLIELAQKPIDQQRDLLDQEFETWKGPIEQIDDVCVIGVKV